MLISLATTFARPADLVLISFGGSFAFGTAGGGSTGLGEGGGLAVLLRDNRLSRWNGSVGVFASVSLLHVESDDVLDSLSVFTSFNCCIRLGFKSSSTSILNILPLKTSATFAVTSVIMVHREDPSVVGEDSGPNARLKRCNLLLSTILLLSFDIDVDFEIGDLVRFFEIPRGFKTVFVTVVASFASAKVPPTASKAWAVSLIGRSTLSELLSASASSSSWIHCAGALSLSVGSIASASIKSNVASVGNMPGESSVFICRESEHEECDKVPENMRLHVFASPDLVVAGVNGR